MRDGLAERLLANVMGWAPEDVARERPILQALAQLKYDEYQQFSPGMRFVECLARWVGQFKAPDERRVAYDFIKRRLVFLSEAEMAHFAAVMYPDFIKPMLLERAATASHIEPHRVGAIARSPAFLQLQASTLFFALSDGARIDQFRRSNRDLRHEQIFPSYELGSERVHEARDWLRDQGTTGPVPAIVLLDDFAGSATSYVRPELTGFGGKIPKFLDRVTSTGCWRDIVQFPETRVIVALYVATAQAMDNLRAAAHELQARYRADFTVVQVQLLDEGVRVTATSDEPFVKLVETYYDPSLENEHTAKGGTDLKYGFAACGLPLVLHHNTPNNSLFLVWAEDSDRVRPLFERFSRHRSEP